MDQNWPAKQFLLACRPAKQFLLRISIKLLYNLAIKLNNMISANNQLEQTHLGKYRRASVGDWGSCIISGTVRWLTVLRRPQVQARVRTHARHRTYHFFLCILRPIKIWGNTHEVMTCSIKIWGNTHEVMTCARLKRVILKYFFSVGDILDYATKILCYEEIWVLCL